MKKINFIKYLLIIILYSLMMTGGTYAYMYSSASNNDIINGGMASIDLNLNVSKVLPTKDGVDDIVIINFNELAISLNNKCSDADGEFALCQLYKVTLTNSGINTNIKGSIAFNNENTPNLSWIYLGNTYNASTNYNTSSFGGSYNSSSKNFKPFVSSYLLEKGDSIDFYILVWVNESDDEQLDEGTYTGKVRFEDSNGHGVTATFAGNEVSFND